MPEEGWEVGTTNSEEGNLRPGKGNNNNGTYHSRARTTMTCLLCMLFVAKSIFLNHSESVDATAKLELRSKDYSRHYGSTCRPERSPHNPKQRMCAQGTTVFSHTKRKEGGWWRAADALLNHKPDTMQNISCLLSTPLDPHFLLQLEIAETNYCLFSKPQNLVVHETLVVANTHTHTTATNTLATGAYRNGNSYAKHP